MVVINVQGYQPKFIRIEALKVFDLMLKQKVFFLTTVAIFSELVRMISF